MSPPLCSRTGRECPRADCLGATDPGVCSLWDKLREWAALGEAEQQAYFLRATNPDASPAELALMMAVDLCEFGQSGNCGCNGRPRTCTKSGSPVEVERARECFACQAEKLAR